METRSFAAGSYRYAPGVFQYSAGVAAEPGYEIVRARFRQALPMAAGFARIARHLAEQGRPLQAFCACELRSPAPFTEAGFRSFNEVYVGTLDGWGIVRGGDNPVARSNVCPAIDPPPEPSFHAFCYTRPAAAAAPSFVVSGSGEAPEGRASYRDHIVRRGETGIAALRDKAAFVMSAMEARLAVLGHGWRDTSDVQVYTVADFHPILADGLLRRGAGTAGLTWHYCRPPVVDLDFEMDCRGLSVELAI